MGLVLARDFAPLSRRDRRLDQGRLPWVAGTLRRVRQPQEHAGEPRPQPAVHAARLRRYLLLPSLRREHAAGGDDGRAGAGVRQGKALYAGISSYPAQQTRDAHRILQEMGVPVILHQPSYSVLNRWIEIDHTIDACGDLGIGVIAFSRCPRACCQASTLRVAGPARAPSIPWDPAREPVEPRVLAAVDRLGEIARGRGQTLVQLALAWVLRRPEMTSTPDRRTHARSVEGELGRARQPRTEPRGDRRDRRRHQGRPDQPVPHARELAELKPVADGRQEAP